MKIVALTASNFKRLEAVEIKPDGNVVLITGKNEAGKSSVLDAIAAALCGKKACPPKPIREGETTAQVMVQTENWTVTRRWTEKGTYLDITAGEGMKASKPQELLDKIVGEIAFDPMRFLQYDARKQREILMELVGLDLTGFDRQIADIKEKRSGIRRHYEHLEHQAKDMPEPEKDLPTEPLSVVKLTADLQSAMRFNAAIDTQERDLARLSAEADERLKIIADIKEKIKALQSHAEAASKELEATRKAISECSTIEPKKDVDAIQAEIASVGHTNQKIMEAKQRAGILEQVTDLKAEYSRLGDESKEREQAKAQKLAEVQMPIPGLSVSEDGVLHDGIPLEQVNTAKKLQIGVAMGMALNPKLKVIRMDGTHLDSAGLKAVAQMVKDKDYQCWIERVDESGKTGIVIEDGMVAGTRVAKDEVETPIPANSEAEADQPPAPIEEPPGSLFKT